MKFARYVAATVAASLLCAGLAVAKPTVFAFGTVKYDPEKTWNSFVVLSGSGTTKLIDRNGNLVHEWPLQGGQGFPARVYEGGYLVANLYPGFAQGYQDANTVGVLDFDGNIIRKFSRFLQVDEGSRGQPADADGTYWVSRAHHDTQLEGVSAGYYAPGQTVNLDGDMLVLAHNTTWNAAINPLVRLHDDVILIVDKDENILWRWDAADHFEEFGLQKYPEAMQLLQAYEHPIFPEHEREFVGYDWLHINCASWLGPNKWYDAGDERFHPENIIADGRETGHLFIIDHVTGKIVWQVAPPFVGPDAALGAFIGPHGTHMIPAGLPGAGNILVFDNGGRSPYFPDINYYYSRIVEFDPVAKEIVWEYSHKTLFPGQSWANFGDQVFYSPFISSAQRLPNGNTLIDEGSSGRLIEVTPELEIVWEYVSPYNYVPFMGGSVLYRAYAVPYEWVPQLDKPAEVAVVPPSTGQLLIPDVNGNIPDILPRLDTSPTAKFADPTPAMTPAFVEAHQ